MDESISCSSNLQPNLAGTSFLVDVNHDTNAKHAGNKDIVLVPAPSADLEDPLNWAQTRKYLFMSCLAISSFSSAFGNSVVYSILVPLAEETSLKLATLNQGTGYLYLLAGWGLLVWQPLAERFGKRPIYLICLSGCIGMTLWAPFSKGNGQWIGRNVLAGLFVAPWEALGAVSINDVFFQHERGRFVALYIASLAMGNLMAPLLSGFIAEYAGWRWVFYVSAIVNSFALVYCALFWEESKYTARVANVQQPQSRIHHETVQPKGAEDLGENLKGIRTIDYAAYPQKTFIQRLSVWNPTPVNIFSRMWDALSYVTWPVVFFAGFSFGACTGRMLTVSWIWYNVLNATTSLIFTEVYNFKSDIVGVTYIAPALGYMVSAPFVGQVSDYIIVYRARKRHGVAEAEDRLWLFAATVVLTPGALLLWGLGAAHHVNWFGLCFAEALMACVNCIGATISLTYLVDAYPAIAGEATTGSLLVRNTMSFAISYGVTPWVMNLGIRNCFISAAFIGLFVSLAFIPMMIWGKQMRKRSQDKYARKVATLPNARR